jgi:hypothetical protein
MVLLWLEVAAEDLAAVAGGERFPRGERDFFRPDGAEAAVGQADASAVHAPLVVVAGEAEGLRVLKPLLVLRRRPRCAERRDEQAEPDREDAEQDERINAAEAATPSRVHDRLPLTLAW